MNENLYSSSRDAETPTNRENAFLLATRQLHRYGPNFRPFKLFYRFLLQPKKLSLRSIPVTGRRRDFFDEPPESCVLTRITDENFSPACAGEEEEGTIIRRRLHKSTAGVSRLSLPDVTNRALASCRRFLGPEASPHTRKQGRDPISVRAHLPR